MSRELTHVRRLVVKVGSTSLTRAGGLDDEQIRNLAGQLGALRKRGIACVLVSSGAIAAGLEPLALKRKPTDIPSLQAAASVGQGILCMRTSGRSRAGRSPSGRCC